MCIYLYIFYEKIPVRYKSNCFGEVFFIIRHETLYILLLHLKVPQSMETVSLFLVILLPKCYTEADL